MDTKYDLTIGDLQDIELVLVEASAWGVRGEVEDAAQNYIDGGIHPVDAYHFAFEDKTTAI
jgi:hypothetical protein